MRMIGHLDNKASATAFSDYLYVNGISNIVEAERDGYAIWIHSEDELEKARDLLNGFQRNPSDPKYAQHSREAQELKQKQQDEDRAAERRHFDRDRIFKPWFGPGPATSLLIALSIITTVCISFGWAAEFFVQYFHFSTYPRNAPEINHGQVWRFVTPIFIHAPLTSLGLGMLHLPFNMLWLYDLGSMIERQRGTWRFLVLALVTAAISNAAQYYFGFWLFGGMSGVVYGLLGYAWVKGKVDPESGLFVHSQTMTFMMVWFFLCLFGFIGNVANTAHGVGLGFGVAWGWLSSWRRPTR